MIELLIGALAFAAIAGLGSGIQGAVKDGAVCDQIKNLNSDISSYVSTQQSIVDAINANTQIELDSINDLNAKIAIGSSVHPNMIFLQLFLIK